ncbi:MAG: hypothetical protein LBG28_09625 [Tannerella sp.]|jgi:hypothetical protein|nr:hypothetical protein [Tannerella sp.]
MDSIEEAFSIIPDSVELAENKKNNVGMILCDSILDISQEKNLRLFISLVCNYVNKQLIYPETEYKSKFEEEVIMALYYDSSGFVYKVEPIWFTRNKAFLTEASRIIKSMPRFPVNRSGVIGVPFVFDIQRYDSIQLKKTFQ